MVVINMGPVPAPSTRRGREEIFFPLPAVPAPQLKMVDPPPTSTDGAKSQPFPSRIGQLDGICGTMPMALAHCTQKFVNNSWCQLCFVEGKGGLLRGYKMKQFV